MRRQPDLPRFSAPAGLIIGRPDGAVVRATGLRYARAARFGPPEPEPAAAAPIVATAPAPACPQVTDSRLDQVLGNLFADLTFAEDCLRLSITLPADRQPAERLPVIVWVHGGSYVTGAGDLPIYDPATLVAEQRVVFVAVTYRLGLLGFLGSPGGAPPNLGLLDLLEALRWVRRNIGAFGGDAALVTLLGQSAGADAIAHLMIADGARGLFRRVIMHSTPLGLAAGRAPMQRAMAAAVGPFEAATPLADVLAREAAVHRAARGFGLKSGMPFGPHYGAAPLPPEHDAGQAWAAIAPEIDVLIGTTTEETRFFAVAEPKYRRWLGLPLLGSLLTRVLVPLTSGRIYVNPSRAFAQRHAGAGGRAYFFRVIYRPPGSLLGAAHTIDLPLLLGSRESWTATPLLGRATWEEVLEAGRPLRRLWADFARTGALPVRLTIPEVVELEAVTRAR